MFHLPSRFDLQILTMCFGGKKFEAWSKKNKFDTKSVKLFAYLIYFLFFEIKDHEVNTYNLKGTSKQLRLYIMYCSKNNNRGHSLHLKHINSKNKFYINLNLLKNFMKTFFNNLWDFVKKYFVSRHMWFVL